MPPPRLMREIPQEPPRIGRVLRELRPKHGFTGEYIGSVIDTTQGYYSGLENGKR